MERWILSGNHRRKSGNNGKNKNHFLLVTPLTRAGTGKTYASAFAMRELGLQRVLFLVHRGQLAKQTKKSYERVFEKTVSMGLVGAGYSDYDKDYVFETVQTYDTRKQVFDLIKVGLNKYEEKQRCGATEVNRFVLYEKYSRRDVSLLMHCGKDLSSIMYGMKKIDDDVFIFVTYHKEETYDEKNYVDGKPDYADSFEDNMIFRWDSQIGKGIDSSYMKDVMSAKNKHLLVKKSDAESNFYYVGQFDVIETVETRKQNNKGKMEPICKVKMKMHHSVRDDLLRYLNSGLKEEMIG